MNRKFLYKVYAQDGTTFQEELSRDVISEPEFEKNIHGGIGQLKISLKRPINDFGFGNTLDYNYVVKVFLNDDFNTNEQIYLGYISSFEPMLMFDREYINIVCLGAVIDLNRDYYRDGSDYITKKTDMAPEEIMKDIIDNYRLLSSNPLVNYDISSIDSTGSSITREFRHLSHLDALRDIARFLPVYWYWFVDGKGILKIKNSANEQVHRFVLGRDIKDIVGNKNVENVINRITVDNGKSPDSADYIKNTYEDVTSQSNYGIRTEYRTDNKIENLSDLDVYGNAYIDEKKDPTDEMNIALSYKINQGIIEPGHLMQVRNIDNSAHTTIPDDLKIVRIKYKPDSTVLIVSSVSKDVNMVALRQTKDVSAKLKEMDTKTQDMLQGKYDYTNASINVGQGSNAGIINSEGKTGYGDGITGFSFEFDGIYPKMDIYGDSSSYFQFDASVGIFNISGTLVIGNPIEVREDINVEDGADVTSSHDCQNPGDYTQAQLNLGADIKEAVIDGTTLIDGGLVRTDFLSADNITTGTLTSILMQTSPYDYDGIKMSESRGGMDVFGGAIYLRDDSNTLRGYFGADSDKTYLIGADDYTDAWIGSYRDIVLDAAEFFAVRPNRCNTGLGSTDTPWSYVTAGTFTIADEDGGGVRAYITSDSDNDIKFEFANEVNLGGAFLEGTDVWYTYSDSTKYISWESLVELWAIQGDCYVYGSLDATVKNFRIPHPTKPNKDLVHSSVESNERMTVYKGNTYIEDGECKITMPDWFIPLNGTNKDDYSYILTSIGQKNDLWVFKEMDEEGKVIFHGEKDGKFSYMITAVRHDKYAEENRIEVETLKK